MDILNSCDVVTDTTTSRPLDGEVSKTGPQMRHCAFVNLPFIVQYVG